jgi:dipeptidyl aminopeptidase/acylaminoacyl peptidase
MPPLVGHHWFVTGLFFPPDPDTLISVSWDGVIRRWDLKTGKPKSPRTGTVPGYTSHMCVALSPDGRWAAVADRDGRIDLWQPATGKFVHALRTAGPAVSNLAFRPDGKELAVAQHNGRIGIWNLAERREVRSIQVDGKEKADSRVWFAALSYTRDGGTLFAATEDGARLWNADTGKLLGKHTGAESWSIHPDGKRVAGLRDGNLHFDDPASGRELAEPIALGANVSGYRFVPDGTLLVTWHFNYENHAGSISFRDPATGRERRKIEGDCGFVYFASVSPDGKLLFTGHDHKVRLWETATGQEVWSRTGHHGRVWQCQFGPDGKSALSAAWDQTAVYWSLRPDAAAAPKTEKLWDDLAGNATVGYRAIWALIDDPRMAAELLRTRLQPVKVDATKERIAALIGELDSLTFNNRQAAERALAELDGAAAPSLREALPKAKSPEQRQRIEQLLTRLGREPNAGDLRVMRSVQTLELSGTTDAVAVLRHWASGTPGALLTEQARSALQRCQQLARK